MNEISYVNGRFRLNSSRKRLTILLFVSLLFVATGIWAVTKGDAKGWFVASLFSLAALIFIVQLLPDASYLELTNEGLTLVSFFRKRTWRWNDVENFEAWRVGRNNMIGFNFSDSYVSNLPAARKTGAELSRKLTGFAGALPETYGLKAVELAGLLNREKEKWTSANR